jgi:hypothetical protein
MGVLDIKCGTDHPSIDCQIAAYWELERSGTTEGLTFEQDTHTFSAHGALIPSATQILKDASMTPNYSFIDPWYANRGSIVHKVTELFDKGTLDHGSVDPQVKGFFTAYRNFRKDFPVDILGIEVKLWSSKYGYAGIIDRIIKGEASYKLFLRKNGTYKLKEVNRIQTHLHAFLSALIIVTGNRTEAQKEIAKINLENWIRKNNGKSHA